MLYFSYYKSKSFNTQMYHECVEFYTPGGARRPYSKWNNQAQCTQNGGQWIQFSNFLEKAPGEERNKNKRKYFPHNHK